MTDLNKKYSRYDGTEVVRRVLCPSKSSKYMFKNLKFVEIGATAGSGTNYETRLLRTTRNRKTLETIAHRSKYSYFN